MLPPVVILVRHGESEHHVLGLTGGWTDTPLTRLGHEQAERLASRLGVELEGMPVRLYSSDLLRAAETASHVGRALGVEPAANPRLRELNNGEAAGLTIAEADARFPGQAGVSIWAQEQGLWPGAESGREFSARCGGFLEELDAEAAVPVLVTHGGTILAMVAHWLLVAPENLASIGFATYPTGITVLVSSPVRGVERMNDIAHLVGTEAYMSLGRAVGQQRPGPQSSEET